MFCVRAGGRSLRKIRLQRNLVAWKGIRLSWLNELVKLEAYLCTEGVQVSKIDVAVVVAVIATVIPRVSGP